ncbi:MAG: hypothetical protein Q8O94_03615 [bacterium]|nr:hypothetical protein [bacterium]
MNPVVDFPKLKSPFVRRVIDGRYVVTPEIEPGYEWVFEDQGVKAVDKLDGSGFCLFIEDGIVKSIDNRGTRIFHTPQLDLNVTGFANMALEGIMMNREKLKGLSGRTYGELVGPRVNGNIHLLDHHLFVPFDYLRSSCHWKSWIENKYPKDFDSISDWFRELPSLFTKRVAKQDALAEGLVFYGRDGRMAKLRRNYFEWFEEEPKHESHPL